MASSILLNLDLNTAPATRTLNSFYAGIKSLSGAKPLGTINGDVNEFSKSMAAATARITAFGATAGIFYNVGKAISESVNATILVNKQLVELNTYLDQSQAGIRKFGDSLFSIAKNAGVPFEKAAEAAKEFARQGLSSEETLKRTNSALILARISGQGFAESVNGITTAINSFSKEALTAEQITNKLIAVDTKFAVSSAQIADAISRVGSSAQESGVGIDKLIATVTAVQQISGRGGAVIGNSLKTIFTRLARPEILDQLEQLGVSVKDQNGFLLDGIKILDNYTKATENLSQVEKARNDELLGGTYQINSLKTITRDLASANSILAAAYKISAGATDEAIKKNELLNESLDATIQRAKTSATQVASRYGTGIFSPLIRRGATAIGRPQGEDGDVKKESSRLGEQISLGIGNAIAGPGVLIAGAIITKLSYQASVFLTNATKHILGFKNATEGVALLQSRINETLAKSPDLIQIIAANSNRRKEVEQEVINRIIQQNNELKIQAELVGSISGALTANKVRSPDQLVSPASSGPISVSSSGGRRGLGGSRSSSIPSIAAASLGASIPLLVPTPKKGINLDALNTLGFAAQFAGNVASGPAIENGNQTGLTASKLVNYLPTLISGITAIAKFRGGDKGGALLSAGFGVGSALYGAVQNKGLQGEFDSKRLQEELDKSSETFTKLNGSTTELIDILSKLEQAYKDPNASPEAIVKLNRERSNLIGKFAAGNPQIAAKLLSAGTIDKQTEIIEENAKQAARDKATRDNFINLRSKARTPAQLTGFVRDLTAGANDKLLENTSGLNAQNLPALLKASGLDSVNDVLAKLPELTEPLIQSIKGQERIAKAIEVSQEKSTKLRKPEIEAAQEVDYRRKLRETESKGLLDNLSGLSSYSSNFGARASLFANRDIEVAKGNSGISTSFLNKVGVAASDKKIGFGDNIFSQLKGIQGPGQEAGKVIDSLLTLPDLTKEQTKALVEIAGYNRQSIKDSDSIRDNAEITRRNQEKLLTIQEKLSFGGGIKTSIDAAARIESQKGTLRGALQANLGRQFGSEKTAIGGEANLFSALKEKYPGILEGSSDVTSTSKRLALSKASDLRSDLLRDANLLQNQGKKEAANRLLRAANNPQSLQEIGIQQSQSLLGSPGTPGEVTGGINRYQNSQVASVAEKSQGNALETALRKNNEAPLAELAQSLGEITAQQGKLLSDSVAAAIKGGLNNTKVVSIVSEKVEIGSGSSSGAPVAQSKGYIPTFYNPLREAISRESKYVPSSSVRVNQSSGFVNRDNPFGFAVTNTFDEPHGLKSLNMSRGYVPNFAKKIVKPSSALDLLLRNVPKGLLSGPKDGQSLPFFPSGSFQNAYDPQPTIEEIIEPKKVRPLNKTALSAQFGAKVRRLASYATANRTEPSVFQGAISRLSSQYSSAGVPESLLKAQIRNSLPSLPAPLRFSLDGYKTGNAAPGRSNFLSFSAPTFGRGIEAGDAYLSSAIDRVAPKFRGVGSSLGNFLSLSSAGSEPSIGQAALKNLIGQSNAIKNYGVSAESSNVYQRAFFSDLVKRGSIKASEIGLIDSSFAANNPNFGKSLLSRIGGGLAPAAKILGTGLGGLGVLGGGLEAYQGYQSGNYGQAGLGAFTAGSSALGLASSFGLAGSLAPLSAGLGAIGAGIAVAQGGYKLGNLIEDKLGLGNKLGNLISGNAGIEAARSGRVANFKLSDFETKEDYRRYLQENQKRLAGYSSGLIPNYAYAQERAGIASNPDYAGFRNASPMRSKIYSNAIINSSEMEIPAKEVYARMFGPAGRALSPANPSQTHAILNPAQQQALGFSNGFVPNFSMEQFASAISDALKGISTGGSTSTNSNTININDSRSFQTGSDKVDGVIEFLQKQFPKEMSKLGPRFAS